MKEQVVNHANILEWRSLHAKAWNINGNEQVKKTFQKVDRESFEGQKGRHLLSLNMV